MLLWAHGQLAMAPLRLMQHRKTGEALHYILLDYEKLVTKFNDNGLAGFSADYSA